MTSVDLDEDERFRLSGRCGELVSRRLQKELSGYCCPEVVVSGMRHVDFILTDLGLFLFRIAALGKNRTVERRNHQFRDIDVLLEDYIDTAAIQDDGRWRIRVSVPDGCVPGTSRPYSLRGIEQAVIAWKHTINSLVLPAMIRIAMPFWLSRQFTEALEREFPAFTQIIGNPSQDRIRREWEEKHHARTGTAEGPDLLQTRARREWDEKQRAERDAWIDNRVSELRAQDERSSAAAHEAEDRRLETLIAERRRQRAELDKSDAPSLGDMPEVTPIATPEGSTK